MKLSICFLIILVFGMVGAIYCHEMVHVAIYKSYGIESHIEPFSNLPFVMTIPEEPCYIESCVLAHNINEAVSYTLFPLFAVLGIGILYILLLKEEIYKELINEKLKM